jgi:hypothetical protein
MVLMDGMARWSDSVGAALVFDTPAYHQPGFRVAVGHSLRDARQRAMDARRAMIDRATNAWRTMGRDQRTVCPTCDGTGEDPDGDGDCDACNGTGYLEDAARRAATSPGSGLAERHATPRDARRAAYDEYCTRIQNAWRTPSRDAAQPDMGTRPGEMPFRRVSPQQFATAYNRGTSPGPGSDNPEEIRRRAIEERDYQLQNAWRSPGADPRRADQIERQGEIWRGGR